MTICRHYFNLRSTKQSVLDCLIQPIFDRLSPLFSIDVPKTVASTMEGISSSDDESWSSSLQFQNSVWNMIVKATWDERLRKYADNEARFKQKFQEAFLEKAKELLPKLQEFFDCDETWLAISRSSERLLKTVEDESEALLAAMDERKYKMFKEIDWEVAKSHLDTDSGEEEEADVD